MTREMMMKTTNELRKNKGDWVTVGSDHTGHWEGCQTLAIVYEDGSYEVAWLGENMAQILKNYAEYNGYGVVEGIEVVA